MGDLWLLERFRRWPEAVALVWQDRPFTYEWLQEAAASWDRRLRAEEAGAGSIVALHTDHSPQACALLLALFRRGAIAVLRSRAGRTPWDERAAIAEVQLTVAFDTDDGWQIERRDVSVENPVTRLLIERDEPGLILFSSGSTGTPKAALHSVPRFLRKFEAERPPLRAAGVPPMDHLSGLDTLFYTLAGGGTLVCMPDRDPETVCRAIARHRVELLPASPTFLNLLGISGAYRGFDLSSLKWIAYGSEPMPNGTLARLRETFPQARLLQKYGMTELGSPPTRSREDGSLWVKIDSPDFRVKVVEGELWIRAEFAMVGYLNAPSPFDADGWLNTGDVVDVDGDYLRILGRRSEIISVGGRKVYPAEVENVLLQMENVSDATVYGDRNPLTGQVVAARVTLSVPEDLAGLKRRVRSFCKDHLDPCKIPLKIEIADGEQFNERYKKVRPLASRS